MFAALATCPVESRPVVLELFTSEGCSSCPPADALLTELAERRDVLALAFHVTYWNALGWRDPFSQAFATQRQADYAARLGGGSYTPELVVDGTTGVVGSDRNAVTVAVAAARRAAARGPTIRIDGQGSTLAISIAGGGRGSRVLLVGYDPRHATMVGRGENAGHSLIESNIVRSFGEIATYAGAPLTFRVRRGAGERATVLLQAPDGAIISAASGS